MSGFGPNALVIEGSLANAEASAGYWDEIIVPLLTMRDAGGLPMSNATRPEVAEPSGLTGWSGLKYDHDDDNTHTAAFCFMMPTTFAELEDQFIVEIIARKVDATDENADLSLAANVEWFTPGVASNDPDGTFNSASAGDTSTTTLATAALAVMDASAAAALSEFARYTLDIGYRLRAESARINQGDMVKLTVYPHETVGSADMDLEILGIVIRLKRHATVTRDKRL